MNRNKITEIIIVTVFYLLNWTTAAHAYIDPGSTSAIITAILGFFAAAGYTLNKYIYKIKNFFSKNVKQDELEKKFDDKS